MENLSHVFWLGGGPCSGKTTASDVLGARGTALVFHVDAHRDEIRRRHDPLRHPALAALYSRLSRMSIQEAMTAWLSVPFEESMAQSVRFFREETEVATEIIRSLPSDRPILVDSTHMLPELAAELGVVDRAFFLLATPEVIRRRNRERHVRGPELKFAWSEALLEKQEQSFIDRTKYILETADRLGCATMVIDGSLAPESVAERIAEQLGLRGRGARATIGSEAEER